MTDDHVGSNLAPLLRTLKPKMKEPVSAKVLNTWIAQAEGQLGDETKGGRLGWLIASSVAVGAVQRALDEGRRPAPAPRPHRHDWYADADRGARGSCRRVQGQGRRGRQARATDKELAADPCRIRALERRLQPSGHVRWRRVVA